MHHEILLALSGHPSSLLYPSADRSEDRKLQDLLSPAETTLLQTLARDLGEKHKNIRERASSISSAHGSIICRAVSTAIISTHLASFQQKILEVERDILEGNPSLVGANNVVPLSSLVRAFDGWDRRLHWLWCLVEFIQPDSANIKEKGEVSQRPCTADTILGRLRESTQTGYPDIEPIALHLTKIAEGAWLKQVSAWVLYGRLPLVGNDFFIVEETKTGKGDVNATDPYSVKASLVPPFVTPSTANSILFIGRSINHIRNKRSMMAHGFSAGISPELEGLPAHLAHLASLGSPINSSNLSAAISAIRLSLSKNALQKLLPQSKVLELLRILKDFFLLERGEFAVALLSAADEGLASRQHRLLDKPLLEGLGNVVIKEGEVSAILARTWTTLSSLQGADDDEGGESLGLARELLRLKINNNDSAADSKGQTASAKLEPSFHSFLLPTPTSLSLHIPSPLHLVLSASNVETYSRIHAYLLAVRRGHLRLSQLSLLSVLRREHPSPITQIQLPHHERMKILAHMRERATSRSKNMRPIWAAIGSATFLLAELSEYLQGQIIRSSWQKFHLWLNPPSSRPPTSSSTSSSSTASSTSSTSSATQSSSSTPIHDPETLSLAHRAYLSALTRHLLLPHTGFTSALSLLLKSTEHSCGLMTAISTVQRGLDLETDHGVQNAFTNYAVEEAKLLLELLAAARDLRGRVSGVVAALRDVDRARRKTVGGLIPGLLPGAKKQVGEEEEVEEEVVVEEQKEVEDDERREDEEGRFVPWKGFGVESLLLELELGGLGKTGG